MLVAVLLLLYTIHRTCPRQYEFTTRKHVQLLLFCIHKKSVIKLHEIHIGELKVSGYMKMRKVVIVMWPMSSVT